LYKSPSIFPAKKSPSAIEILNQREKLAYIKFEDQFFMLLPHHPKPLYLSSFCTQFTLNKPSGRCKSFPLDSIPSAALSEEMRVGVEMKEKLF